VDLAAVCVVRHSAAVEALTYKLAGLERTARLVDSDNEFCRQAIACSVARSDYI